MEEKEEQKKKFCDRIIEVLKDFIIKADSMKEYVFSAMNEQTKKLISFMKKSNKEVSLLSELFVDKDTIESTAQIEIDLENYKNLQDKIKGTSYCSKLVINGEIVSLISAFDYFLRDLLKETCIFQYEEFNNFSNIKDIALKFGEIKNCNSIDEVKNYCIEKYLDGLFAGSHDFIFEEIKNKFNVKDIKNHNHYKDLLFVTELRNIIVHNDSQISIMFRNKMDELKIDYKQYGMIDDNGIVKINPNNIEYIFEILIFCAIYISLSFAIQFSKKNKDELENFLSNINDIGLNCINRHYKISIELYDCLLKMAKSSSDKFLYTINKCIALKDGNQITEMENQLNSLDWSNCNNSFKFAKNCLLNEYDEAIEFLKKRSTEEKEEWKFNLQVWPLCKQLVKSEVFLKEYPIIFDEEFENKIKVWENTKKDLDEIEKEIRKMIESKESHRSKNKVKQDESTNKEEN